MGSIDHLELFQHTSERGNVMPLGEVSRLNPSVTQGLAHDVEIQRVSEQSPRRTTGMQEIIGQEIRRLMEMVQETRFVPDDLREKFIMRVLSPLTEAYLGHMEQAAELLDLAPERLELLQRMARLRTQESTTPTHVPQTIAAPPAPVKKPSTLSEGAQAIIAKYAELKNHIATFLTGGGNLASVETLEPIFSKENWKLVEDIARRGSVDRARTMLAEKWRTWKLRLQAAGYQLPNLKI